MNSIKPTKVLLVEDDDDDYLIFRSILGDIPDSLFDLERVATFDLGFAALTNNNYDVALIDYHLGGSTGLDLIKALRAQQIDTPLILLTGRSEIEMETDAMQTGASDFLEKGHFDFRLLRRSLRYAISRRDKSNESLRRIAAAVHQTADGVVITTPEGIIEYVNPAYEALLGIPRDELIGKKREFFDSGLQEGISKEDIKSTLMSGNTWMGKVSQKRRDGSRYDVQVTISPIFDDKKHLINYVVTKKDVTYQTQMEGDLRQSQKMDAIGQLAGGIAHDFNNLLTVICGYSEMLLSDATISEQAKSKISEIYESGHRAAKLTGQLLAFSRKQPTVLDVVDVNEVILRMEQLLLRLIGENVLLSLNLADSSLHIKIDVNQLEQIFLNLCINARDAMPDGGKITVTTKKIDAIPPTIEIEVSDSGIGMSEEVQKHIFEPFYTTKALGKGTGLGLSTVYGIVKREGGTINLNSRVGEGTTFKIQFPEISKDDEVVGSEEKVKSDLKGTEKILIVEDEDGLRQLVQSCLKEYGYSVLSASNGEEGLKRGLAITEQPLALVVTDVRMPIMGGREMVQVLRRTSPHLKAIFMSGYSDIAFGKEGFEADEFTQFIEKPFSPMAVLGKIRSLLNSADGEVVN